MPYFCYRCNQPRSQCPPGDEIGGCALVEADAAEYRQEKAGYKPMFQTHRLRSMNDANTTSREMRDDIYREARRTGRDIERAR